MTGTGRLIVVGGHSRHVGKTTLVMTLLQCLEPAQWVAVKISGHSHRLEPGPQPGEPDERAALQSARFREAGARNALLLRAPDDRFADAAATVQGLVDAGNNVIAESNRLVAWCKPDLVLFVVAPAISDWKPSSGLCLRAADAIVTFGEHALSGRAHASHDDVGLGLPRFHLDGGQLQTKALVSLLRRRLHPTGAASSSFGRDAIMRSA